MKNQTWDLPKAQEGTAVDLEEILGQDPGQPGVA